MHSPLRAVAAFVAGPLSRGTAQISMSVAAGVCVALVTQALLPDRREPAATEIQRQVVETVTPRDDRLPKISDAAPTGALDGAERPSVVEIESGKAETRIAKLPAVAPRADYRAPEEPGPQPYIPPMADSGSPGVPLAAEGSHPAPLASAEAAPRPPADIPGQPMVLPGAVPQRDLAIDDEFDAGAPATGGERRRPVLALPFNAVEESVFKLGDVVASIGRSDRRY